MALSAPPAVSALARSLADPDPRVRSLAAIALRAIGPNAAGAIPSLVKALNDSAGYVRALAADTLGSIGPAAKPAVGDLTKHLLDPNEQVVFVLRSVAQALGNSVPMPPARYPRWNRH